jgi:hypothetical protein
MPDQRRNRTGKVLVRNFSGNPINQDLSRSGCYDERQ